MSAKNELLKMIDERYHKFSKGQKNWRILSVRIMIRQLFDSCEDGGRGRCQ